MKDCNIVYGPVDITGMNNAIQELDDLDLKSQSFFTDEINRMFPSNRYNIKLIPIANAELDGAVNACIVVVTKKMVYADEAKRASHEFLKIRRANSMLLYDPSDNLISIFLRKPEERMVIRNSVEATPETRIHYINDLKGILKSLATYLANI